LTGIPNTALIAGPHLLFGHAYGVCVFEFCLGFLKFIVSRVGSSNVSFALSRRPHDEIGNVSFTSRISSTPMRKTRHRSNRLSSTRPTSQIYSSGSLNTMDNSFSTRLLAPSQGRNSMSFSSSAYPSVYSDVVSGMNLVLCFLSNKYYISSPHLRHPIQADLLVLSARQMVTQRFV
jgi:hypothetical protein